MRTGYRWWLVGTTATTLGDSLMYFALGWVAAEHGAGTAGLVLTAGAVPLRVLILVGGAVADRWGIRRTMIGCDLAALAVLLVFAVVALGSAPVWSLVGISLLTGTAAALRRPAEGVFPRLFGRGDDLARLMAQATMAKQVARTAGPALGGALLAVGGLATIALVDAATCLAVLVVLLVVRPPGEGARRQGGGSLLRDVTECVGLVRRMPGLAATVVAVAGLAVTILPLVSLCVPLIGHLRGWSAGQTGAVAGAWVLGGLLVTAWVARHGLPSRRIAVAGPLPGAAGAAALALTDSIAVAVIGVGLVGIGTSMTTCRLIPRLLDTAAAPELARVQSLLGLAQTAPMLIATPALGAFAALTSPELLALLLAGLLMLTSLAVARAERRTPAHFDRRVAPV